MPLLYQYTWSQWEQHLRLWTENPWVAWDTHQGGYVLAAIMSILLPTARLVLRKTVFEPVGRRVLPSSYKKTDRAEPDPGLVKKFNEAAWKASFYASVIVVGIFAVWHEKFVTDTKYFWIGCTQFPPCNYSVSLLMRFLYSLELGFYFQAIPYLIFWEVRRKDFWENFGHHIATIGLIVYSYEVNFMKIGAMVFLCHDINDVFMESAKMAKYENKNDLANFLFTAFALSWFTSRMAYFPYWVIGSAWNEPISVIANKYKINPHPHHEIFLTLLLFLFALHCYWSYLIVRIIVRQLTQGEVDDIREDPVGDVQAKFQKEAPGIRSP